MEYKPNNRFKFNYSKLSARKCPITNTGEYQTQQLPGPLAGMDLGEPDPVQILPVYRGQVRNVDGQVQNIIYPQYGQTDLYMASYNQLMVYNQNMNIQAKVYEDMLNSGMVPYDD